MQKYWFLYKPPNIYAIFLYYLCDLLLFEHFIPLSVMKISSQGACSLSFANQAFDCVFCLKEKGTLMASSPLFDVLTLFLFVF